MYRVILSYGLKSEAVDKDVAKIFIKSSFEEQFIKISYWKHWKIVNSRETFSPELLSADALTSECYRQKMPQQSNRAQIK